MPIYAAANPLPLGQTNRNLQQPWTEKYRPNEFDKIVLDPLNRRLFYNIIQYRLFPNLLLYGPGGTGKTTTAMALVRAWYKAYPIQQTVTMSSVNSLGIPVIVLNASDDRGIDVIRNQIQQFAQSQNMFGDGYKFVILDEVDAMTKTAQNALKIILQTSAPNVRFCLICNYISRIDDSLRNEFICVRFNQLPPTDIFRFIRNIADAEKVNITDTEIQSVQKLYNADIRSMVNFIQLHQYCNTKEVQAPSSSTEVTTGSSEAGTSFRIIVDQTWEELRALIKGRTPGGHSPSIKQWMYTTAEKYNADILSLCGQYYMYVLTQYPAEATPELLTHMTKVIHSDPESNIDVVVDYFVHTL
jgi:DNA polymerase III delta prime subunit